MNAVLPTRALVRVRVAPDFVGLNSSKLYEDARYQNIFKLRRKMKEFAWMPRIASEILVLNCILSIFIDDFVKGISTCDASDILKQVFRPTDQRIEYKRPSLPLEIRKAIIRIRRELHPDYLRRKNTPQELDLLSELNEVEQSGDIERIMLLIKYASLLIFGTYNSILLDRETFLGKEEELLVNDLLLLMTAAIELNDIRFAQELLKGHLDNLRRQIVIGSEETLIGKLPESTREGVRSFLQALGIIK